jgi:hypothetical protein
MCLICIELTKNKLTAREARRNLEEMHEDLDKEHIFEILRAIWKKEDEQEGPFDAWLSSGPD